MKRIKEPIINKLKSLGRIKLKTVILLLAFISVVYLMLVISLYAAVPQRINYQGKLMDNAGQPVSDGNYSVTFRIYNVSVGGVVLWNENQTASTQDGLFNVILGSVSSINLSFDQDYWLGVEVAGDGEMSPRHRLVSVPYSFRAEDANNSGQLNSQSAGYYLDAGNINNGTLNDSRLSANVTKLGSSIDAGEITTNIVSSIEGVTNDGGNIDLIAGTNMTITPNDVANTITFDGVGGGDNLGNHTATQNIRLNGYYLSGDGGNEGVYVNNDGNVGIGTTTPTSKLELIDNIFVEDFYCAAKIDVNGSGGGPSCDLYGLYVDVLDVTLEADADKYSAAFLGGNVGIGITNPTRRLWVNGDAGGTTAWYNDSHSSYKEKFKEVSVLDKIKSLNIMEWQYKKRHCPQDTYRHLGPFAEDFRNKFGLGKSDYEMQAADVAGVALKAVQEQQIIIEKLNCRISSLEKKIKQLEKQK